jgi:hypothetical protein
MYWIDRGDPQRGRSADRSPTGAGTWSPRGFQNQKKWSVVGFGNARMFLTALGGSVYRCNLDSSEKRRSCSQKET